MTEQTVDWADPAVQESFLRLHRRDGWQTSRASLVALALLTLIGVFQVLSAHTWLYLIAAAAGLGLMLLRIQLVLARLRRLLPHADGITRYRLQDRTLHIRNTAGEYQIPLAQMTRFRPYPGGLIVQYAGSSTFTLPDGPVRRDLELQLKRAPGGPL